MANVNFGDRNAGVESAGDIINSKININNAHADSPGKGKCIFSSKTLSTNWMILTCRSDFLISLAFPNMPV